MNKNVIAEDLGYILRDEGQIEEAIENYSVNELVVNEQNPKAKGFYEHLGFKVYKRNPIDEQGNQYPILFMHLG
mgnify:CR=1 FL=1